jgi:hypothetical protein
MNVQQLTERRLIGRPLNVVINCRPDRIERNGQMGELTGQLQPDKIILIGESTRSARIAVPPEIAHTIVDFGGRPQFDEVVDAFATEGGAGSVVAIGNIHGQGEVLLEHVRQLPRAREEVC